MINFKRHCTTMNDTEQIEFEIDIADHRRRIKEVYRPMLHETKVYDECCERFRKTFRDRDGELVFIRL